jgi:nitroreductase
MDSQLYQAIMARTSVRRYDREPLTEEKLAAVRDIAAAVRPLVAENEFAVLAQDVQPGEDLVATFGGYGRIISPPHYLVPSITGDRHLLVDAGYRAQQIAVRLVLEEIGTCYVGCIRQDEQLTDRFGLPQGARIGAFLIYGTPSEALGGRLANRLIRSAAGANNKMAAERLFFVDSFDNPCSPPEDLASLIEAGRNAASAANAQPWRFLWQDGILHYFVTAQNRRYGESQSEYRFYDGGICMANVSLALEALGMVGMWQMVDGPQADPGDEIPEHPADLEPLARLVLG